MSATITTCEEFTARREARALEKKLQTFSLIQPENRTTEEEMDLLAIAFEQLCEPSKFHPGAVCLQFSVTKELWETNPIAGIFRYTVEENGYLIEEDLFGNIVHVLVRREYRPQKEVVE